ncbi:MAG: zinc ribbon domain-containing protein [Anaerolineae bacterium]
MNRVGQLRNLQQLDQEWDEKGKRFQIVRAELSDQSELTRLRNNYNRIQQELAQTKARLRDSELELAGVQAKVKEVTTSLYSGKVMIPKDLEMLQKESQSLRNRQQHLEDETLTLMAQVESLEEQEKGAGSSLQEYEHANAANQANLTNEYNSLRARLLELQVAREKQRSEISRNDLALYTELRNKKSGVVLAQMIDSSCQVCHVSVPSRMASQVESGDVIVQCEGCGRILFLA